MKFNDAWNVNVYKTFWNLNPDQLKALEWTPQQKMDKVRSIFATQIKSWLEWKDNENDE